MKYARANSAGRKVYIPGSAAAQATAKIGIGKVNETQSTPCDLSVGDKVKHPVFGEGMVLSILPMGGDNLLEITFDKVGTKKIMAKFTKLKKLS